LHCRQRIIPPVSLNSRDNNKKRSCIVPQIGTAERILAEIISSDVALLVTFSQAIDGVIKNNQKARDNPKALAQLDGYKRGLVNSLSGNLQRFGFDKASKVETLQHIIEEMNDAEIEHTAIRGT
jgi:hypothetical protein